MAGSSFRWNTTEFVSELHLFPAKLNAGIAAIMEREATLAEAEMRSGAPWQDQTGNARSGLGATYQFEAPSHHLYLYHSVPYGIWLETMQSGRFATVTPQILKSAERVMSLASGLFGVM